MTDMSWAGLWLLIFVLIGGRVFFYRPSEQRVFTVREEMATYYKTINKACFYVCMTSIALGFVLTLGMIWEVFDNDRVMEKAWLSVAVFFGTAILVALVNATFSLRLAKKSECDE